MMRTLTNSNVSEVKINVRSILDAYQKTELKPIQGEYLLCKDEKWFGCVLIALYLNQIGATFHDVSEDENEMIELIEKSIDAANHQYGVNNTLALILGFDGYPKGKYFDFAEGEYYTIGRWASQQLGL